MNIEDCWDDGALYSIYFETIGCLDIKKKIIVLPVGATDVESMVFKKFNNVRKVLRIEELDFCLILKP